MVHILISADLYKDLGLFQGKNKIRRKRKVDYFQLRKMNYFFAENSKYLGLAPLLYSLALTLLSQSVLLAPSFFAATLAIILGLVGYQYKLCAGYKSEGFSADKIWLKKFILARLSLYLVTSLQIIGVLIYDQLWSWPGIISVILWTASLEIAISNYHPFPQFVYACLAVIGLPPMLFALSPTATMTQILICGLGILYTGYLLLKNRRSYLFFLESLRHLKHSHEESKLLENFMDIIPAKISWLDHALHYKFINEELASFLGINKSFIVGQLHSSTSLPAKTLLTPERLQNFLSQPEQSIVFEETLQDRRHLVHCKKLYSDRGAETVIMAIDIEDQKRIQEQLDEERIHTIHSARLASLGEMAAAIAHEIKNPLAIIHGNLELLKEDVENELPNPESSMTRLNKVLATIFRIVKVIEGLRKLSREESSDHATWSHLQQCFTDSIDICRERFRNHDIELNIVSFPEDIELLCHPEQLAQILLNLLSNAYDILQDQEERKVRVEFIWNADQSLTVAVYDNGPGAKNPEKLFNPFYTTKTIGEGTGLGLSISHRIAKSHESTLVYERKDNWTCFKLTLPSDRCRKTSEVKAA